MTQRVPLVPAINWFSNLIGILHSACTSTFERNLSYSPADNISCSTIIEFETTPGPDVLVIKNWTWSHSFFVFRISMSTSVPWSFFATVCRIKNYIYALLLSRNWLHYVYIFSVIFLTTVLANVQILNIYKMHSFEF